MGTVTGQSVGIDISEDFLDVYLYPAGKEVRLPHNDEGTASLLALLRDFNEREVKRLEAVSEAAVPADEATQTTPGILVSIPGVGKLTANLLAIELPELGRLEDKQIASLVGVAPHPDESGKYRGKAYIRGGRAPGAGELYMAAFNARKYNPVIKAF